VTTPDRFDVPAAKQTVEQQVRHSRSISTVDLVRDRTAFSRLLAVEKRRWPDAGHHCWAYIAGAPGELRHATWSSTLTRSASVPNEEVRSHARYRVCG